jgi:hypothetical protein
MRFAIGAILGAIAAGVAHHAGQSTEIACLVGIGLIIAVWFRLADALWDLGCIILAWALSGGND